MSQRTRPVSETGKRLLGAVTVAGAGVPAVWAGTMHLLALMPPSNIESVTAGAVLGMGLAVGLWYVLSSGLAAVCLAARLAGLAWSGGEALVRRTGPRAVRRLLGGGAGAALVAGSLLLPAHAEDSGVPEEAGAGEPHLTWAPPATAATETTTPAATAEEDTTSHDAVPDVVADPDEEGAAGGPLHDGANPALPPETGDAGQAQDVVEEDSRDGHEPQGPTSAPDQEPGARDDTDGDDAGGPAPSDSAGQAREAGPDDVHLVQPGDTLWHVAAAALGESATDAEIAAAWPQWYRANIDVIGPDPDLIHPGQELATPGRAAS